MTTTYTVACNENIVMVEPDVVKDMTDGGIALPDSVIEADTPCIGTVRAAGPLRRFLDTGATADMPYKEGDRVVFSMFFKNQDRSVTLGGTKYLFMDASDILAILKG